MDADRRWHLQQMGYDPDDITVQLDLAWIRLLMWREVRAGGDPGMLGRRFT